MSNKYYPSERPPVFETIKYINNLIENSNQSWTDEVSGSFNNYIQGKMGDKDLWKRLSVEAGTFQDFSKQEYAKDLQLDIEYRKSVMGSF